MLLSPFRSIEQASLQYVKLKNWVRSNATNVLRIDGHLFVKLKSGRWTCTDGSAGEHAAYPICRQYKHLHLRCTAAYELFGLVSKADADAHRKIVHDKCKTERSTGETAYLRKEARRLGFKLVKRAKRRAAR